MSYQDNGEHSLAHGNKLMIVELRGEIEMDVMKLMLERSSAPILADPAPTREEIQKMLAAATNVSDHRGLKPTKFMIFDGKKRDWLGNLFRKALQKTGNDISEENLDRVAKHVYRAPLIIVVICSVTEHASVPVQEQLLSSGASVQNLILAAHHLGYSAMWRTGAMAYNDVVNEKLGLGTNDRIVSFLYLGTNNREPTAKKHDPLEARILDVEIL